MKRKKLPQDLTGWKRWKPITPSLNRIDVNRVAAFHTNIESIRGRRKITEPVRITRCGCIDSGVRSRYRDTRIQLWIVIAQVDGGLCRQRRAKFLYCVLGDQSSLGPFIRDGLWDSDLRRDVSVHRVKRMDETEVDGQVATNRS